jgi:hypothetical protein
VGESLDARLGDRQFGYEWMAEGNDGNGKGVCILKYTLKVLKCGTASTKRAKQIITFTGFDVALVTKQLA